MVVMKHLVKEGYERCRRFIGISESGVMDGLE